MLRRLTSLQLRQITEALEAGRPLANSEGWALLEELRAVKTLIARWGALMLESSNPRIRTAARGLTMAMRKKES